MAGCQPGNVCCNEQRRCWGTSDDRSKPEMLNRQMVPPKDDEVTDVDFEEVKDDK